MEDNISTQMSEKIGEQETKLGPPEDVTQVATLQQLNVQQGNPAPQTMDQDRFNAQLALEHRMGAQITCQAFAKLGKNAMVRLWNAMHEMPLEGLPVKLNGRLEKEIYMASQKTLMAKHVLVFNKVKAEKQSEEILAKRKEQEQNEKASETQTENQANNKTLDSNG